MSQNLFFGSHAKLRRVKQHITELHDAEKAYIASRPFERFMEPMPDGRIARKVRAKIIPDPDLATVVADALGGLRSSLDLAVCASARASGKGADELKHTYFHFAASELEWKKSYKGRMKAAPARIKATVHRLKPWAGGNDLLHALGRLSVMDKHQLMVPMGILPANPVIRNGVFLEHVEIRGACWDGERNDVILYISGPNIGGVEPQIELQAFFGFGQVDVAAGQPIVPILNQMVNLCQEIVTILEWVSERA